MSKKKTRRWLSLLLAVVMLLSMLPAAAFAVGSSGALARSSSGDDFMRIVHLDAGRKYFSVQSVKALIDAMDEAGYTHLELAFGNDGLRFLLDDMSIDLSGTEANGLLARSNTYDLGDDTTTRPGDDGTAGEGDDSVDGDTTPPTEEVAPPVEETVPEEEPLPIEPIVETGTTYESDAVKAAIQQGNENYNGDARAWDQDDMDEIIGYANDHGIEIIPLLNTPGHMDAILDAMSELDITDAAYSDEWRISGRTIDVTNEKAVAFTQALVQKYVGYFASRSCTYFNMGADEYANDILTDSGMGFGQLIRDGEYGYFVEYVNGLAEMIVGSGMIPMAFNDGIYYDENTEYGGFNENIVIAYWSSGWDGYNVASASYLANMGHKLINTHGDFYYILGVNDQWDTKGIEKAQEWSNTSFMGSTIDNPAGGMFCIWCDYPDAEDEDKIYENVVGSGILSAMAEAMGATAEIPEDVTVTDPSYTSVSVTAPGLTGLTVTPAEDIAVDGASKVLAFDMTPVTAEGDYTGEAVVSISVPEGWNTSSLGAFVQESNGAITKIAGTYADGHYTFTMPHFSVGGIAEYAQETQRIEVAAGSSTTVTIPDVDLSNNVDRSELDGSIATVDVQGGTTEAADNWVRVSNGAAGIESGEEYLIVSGSSNGTQYALTSSGGAAEVTVSNGVIEDEPSNTVFTLEGNGNSYTLQDSNGGYLYPTASYRSGLGGRWNYSLSTNENNGQAVTVDGSSSVTFSRYVTSSYRNTTSYIRYQDNYGFYHDFDAASSGSSLYLFKRNHVEGGLNTTITFNGVSAGTTYVTVGNTRYEIVVTDAPPAGAMTGSSLEVEYWITNSPVREAENENAADSTTIYNTELGVTSEEGVAISDMVPETAYSNYDGWVELHFWQAMRQDSDNHQTGEGGDDETADGTTFTRVRYYNNAWQYMTDDGVWHYFLADDQAVAYYMRHTEITREITTAMKDWGYDPSQPGGTPDSNSGAGQVALTVAVVYPDGNVSPAESDMYANSTITFNYWAGRDIGIIAPLNNSDYTVSRITVTDGTRNTDHSRRTSSWYPDDSITWEKARTDSGSLWYDETEVWNSSMGGEPMVNGKISNITWSGRDTAKLVLIYLEPVHHDSNLRVQWVDDNENGALINSMEVVVSYDTGEEPITFFNGLKQDSDVPQQGGTFTLDDNAYIMNSSDVPQYFNKDITVMDVDAIYKSGLYKYVSAKLSADGKTLTLHYDLDETRLDHSYVLDFGLPVSVPLTELVANPEDVTGVTFSDNSDVRYDSGTGAIVYTPSAVMDDVTTVTARLTIGGEVQSFRIGFYPASNVLYEDSFLSQSSGDNVEWDKGTATPAEQTANNETLYGYDDAYANSSGNSLGSAWTVSGMQSGEYSNFLTTSFEGNGFDLIGTAGQNTGYIYLALAGEQKKLVIIDTNYSQGTLHQVPLAHEMLTEGEYDVTIRAAYRAPAASSSSDAAVVRSYNAASASDSLADVNAMIAEMEQEGMTFDDVEYIYFDQSSALADVEGATYAGGAYETASSNSRIVRAASTSAGTEAAIDGFRVYRNSNNSAYIVSEQDIKYINVLDATLNDETFTAYVDDTTGTWNKGNYEQSGGPQNEVYLQSGNSISFKVNTAEAVQISARAVSGSTSLVVNNGAAQTINSSTEMYYTVQPDSNGIITIKTNGSGMLALGNLKLPDGAQTTALTEEDQIAVLSLLNRASEAPEEPEEPAVFTPETLDVDVKSTKVIFNKVVTLTVSASADVDKLTVNGKEIKPSNSMLVKWGISEDYLYIVMDTVSRNSTKTYDVIAYDANGVASEVYTVQG